VLFFGLLAAGCGTKTYPVQGTVLNETGKPAVELAGGTVQFEALDAPVSAEGTIAADGTFRLGTHRPGEVPHEGKIDASAIEKILGHKSEAQQGVVKITIGREGAMHGVKVAGSMGLTTWAAFSGGDELAAVDGDFIMTAAEVQPVLRALRRANIHVVALHNHMVGEQPAFYFTHFWGKGKAQDLANGLRSALDAQAKAAGKGH
jgi:hypothetical protein